jgi:hypothetical protein
LHKATRAKYRQELEKQQRRVNNGWNGTQLTDAEWDFRFKALADNLPFLRAVDRKEAKEQLTKFMEAAQVSGRRVTAQWPQVLP